MESYVHPSPMAESVSQANSSPELLPAERGKMRKAYLGGFEFEKVVPLSPHELFAH